VVTRRGGRADARGRRARGGRGRRGHARASTRREGYAGRARSSASAGGAGGSEASARETRLRLAATPQTRRFRPRRGPTPAASHRPSRRASQKVRGSNDGARRGQVGRSVRGSEVLRHSPRRLCVFSRRSENVFARAVRRCVVRFMKRSLAARVPTSDSYR
jgi:hypothetical protein